MSGGKSGGSTSAPLTGKQRNDAFNFGIGTINQGLTGEEYRPKKTINIYGKEYVTDPGSGTPQINMPTYTPSTYTAGTYTAAPEAKTLSSGDYAALEKSIVDSRWAPIKRYEDLQRTRTDEDLSKRGIWSSGVATQAQGDVTDTFAPQYAAAGADAATQRYGLQANELQGLNSYNANEALRRTGFDTNEAARRTGFDANNANQVYQSQWAPYDFMRNLYNGTAGNTTTTTNPEQNKWGTALGAGAGFMLGGPAGVIPGATIGGWF
jgi:hypothetical protein